MEAIRKTINTFATIWLVCGLILGILSGAIFFSPIAAVALVITPLFIIGLGAYRARHEPINVRRLGAILTFLIVVPGLFIFVLTRS